MRTIIAGSRKCVTLEDVVNAVNDCPWEITTVVSGKAPGADTFGEMIAGELGIPVDPYPITKEDWEKYGNGAGPVRNRRMAENADALIAVWDGSSTGTLDMINRAKSLKLKVHIRVIGGNTLEDLF